VFGDVNCLVQTVIFPCNKEDSDNSLQSRDRQFARETHGTYIWGEFKDLQAIEDRIIDGPYIHHFVEMRGDYTKEIKEFCKYFQNLRVDEAVK